MGLMALVLGDARLPSGAHAHSGGTEQAVDDGVVSDLDSLREWLEARLQTVVELDAHVAAKACALWCEGAARSAFSELAAEIDARMASPAAREMSRRQGAQYLRAVTSMFADGAFQALDGVGDVGGVAGATSRAPHLAVAVGVASAAAGLQPHDAAGIVAYQSLAGAATAALRLIGLDPVGTSGLVASLVTECDELARRAGGAVARPMAELPCSQAPRLDRFLEIHRARKERLFAS